MGSAAEVLTIGRKPSLKPIVLVLGSLVEGSGTTRHCYTATGEMHRLDLVGCTLDGEQRDWLLSTDDRKVWLTDHVIDWSEERMAAAREEWDGSHYPSLEHASAVLRRLAAVVQELAHCPAQVKGMLLEIQLFLAQPIVEKLPIIVQHAKDVRRSLVDGGLLRDCLTSLASVEKKDIRTLLNAV